MKFRPSNGTDGAGFIDMWCDECERDRAWREGTGDSCEILVATMIYDADDDEYPPEWTYDSNNRPCCTAYIPEGAEVPKPRCVMTNDMFGVIGEGE